MVSAAGMPAAARVSATEMTAASKAVTAAPKAMAAAAEAMATSTEAAKAVSTAAEARRAVTATKGVEPAAGMPGDTAISITRLAETVAEAGWWRTVRL